MYIYKKPISLHNILYDIQRKKLTKSNSNLFLKESLRSKQAYLINHKQFELDEYKTDKKIANMSEAAQLQQQEQSSQVQLEEQLPSKESRSLCKAQCKQSCVSANCPKYKASKTQVPDTNDPKCQKQCMDPCVKASCPTYAEQPMQKESKALCKSKCQECCVVASCPKYTSNNEPKTTSLAQLSAGKVPESCIAPAKRDIFITKSEFYIPKELFQAIVCTRCREKVMAALAERTNETPIITAAETPSTARCRPQDLIRPACGQTNATCTENTQSTQAFIPNACSEGTQMRKNYEVSICSVCRAQEQFAQPSNTPPQYQMESQMMMPCQQSQMTTPFQQSQMMTPCQQPQMVAPCQQSEISSHYQQPQISAPYQQPQISAPYQQSNMSTPFQRSLLTPPYQKAPTSTPCFTTQLSAPIQPPQMSTICPQSQMAAAYEAASMAQSCSPSHYALENYMQTIDKCGKTEATPTLFKTFNALNVCSCEKKLYEPKLKACSCSAKSYQQPFQGSQQQAAMQNPQSSTQCRQQNDINKAPTQSTLPDSAYSDYSESSKRSQKAKYRKQKPYQQQRSRQEQLVYYMPPYMSTQMHIEKKKSTMMLYKQPEFLRNNSNAEMYYDCVSASTSTKKDDQQLMPLNKKTLALDNPKHFHEALQKLTETSQNLLRKFEKALGNKTEYNDKGMRLKIKQKYSSIKLHTNGSDRKFHYIPTIIPVQTAIPMYLKPCRSHKRNHNGKKELSS